MAGDEIEGPEQFENKEDAEAFFEEQEGAKILYISSKNRNSKQDGDLEAIEQLTAKAKKDNDKGPAQNTDYFAVFWFESNEPKGSKRFNTEEEAKKKYDSTAAPKILFQADGNK